MKIRQKMSMRVQMVSMGQSRDGVAFRVVVFIYVVIDDVGEIVLNILLPSPWPSPHWAILDWERGRNWIIYLVLRVPGGS